MQHLRNRVVFFLEKHKNLRFLCNLINNLYAYENDFKKRTR